MYKAFISYRHLPLEKRIAIKLHRRIEHYLIPKELRKNGEKHLGYVFRDQDELPISSDLTANIQQALDRSEYLIVICTPETEKSAWVLREITYFLEHHDRNHVLALLADGSAETSFPAPLTTLCDETGQAIGQIEPLAANIAADSAWKRNRLFATESIRLLAALIGCPYDALYKREQRYKRRRFLAAALLVFAVLGVYIHTLLDRNREIRANLEQALRNQSQYLASESLKLLEDGDRLGAISLAIEALPSETNKRPLVSRAEYALGCAVNAYAVPGYSGELHATGVLSHPSDVDTFCLNESGALLCALLDNGALCTWDTQSMQKRWELSELGQEPVRGVAGFLSDHELIAWSGTELCCLKADSGEPLWSRDANSLEGDSWLPKIYSVGIADESGEVVVSCSEKICVLDGKTGSTLRTIAWPEQEIDQKEVSYSPQRTLVSPDGRRIAAEYSFGGGDCGMAVVDLFDGTLLFSESYPGEYYIPKQGLFPDEDSFLYITYDLSGSSAYTIGNYKGMVRNESELHCVDLKTARTRWKTTHAASAPSGNDLLCFDRELTERPVVVYAYANHLDVLDAESGEKLAETEFSSTLVGLDVFNKTIFCVTENGEEGYIFSKNFSEWFSAKYYVENLSRGISRFGSFWIHPWKSGDIIHYEPIQTDPAWTPIECIWTEQEEEDRFYQDGFYIENGCIAFLDHSRLLISDGDPAHPLREVDLPTDKDSKWKREYTPAYCEDGTLCLYWDERDSKGVVYADTETTEYRVCPWEDTELTLLGLESAREGRDWLALAYRTEGEGETRSVTFLACRLDEELHVKSSLTMGTFPSPCEGSGTVAPSGRIYLYLTEQGKTLCADLRRNTVKECGTALTECLAGIQEREESVSRNSCFSVDGSLLAMKSAGKEWKVMSADGIERITIRAETEKILSASFTPDGQQLLTVEADGFLRRYRLSDGRQQSKAPVYTTSLRDSTEIGWQYTKSGFLALRIGEYLNLISMEDWGVFAYVPTCCGYLEDQDFCICHDYSGGRGGYAGFRRYTLESLIAYGESILGDWEMNEQQRMEYGLS